MLVVDDFGFCFGWGLNRSYMIGIPNRDLNYMAEPTSIHTLAGHRIKAVAAGVDHSIFLSDKGWPFVAGNASQGRVVMSGIFLLTNSAIRKARPVCNRGRMWKSHF